MALARKLTSKIYEIQAHTQKVTCLDLGETGRVLVTGGQDRNVNLWAFGNDKCFMSLTGHNGQIDCVKFAYNDDYVYSADENGVIKRWDLNAQPGCTTFYGHMKSVRTLDFHPYGEYVASGSNDTTVRLWDVRKNNICIDKYRGHIANVNSVKFSPDGSWIASSGTEGSIIIWDIRMRKKIIEFQEHSSPVTCIQFHPFEFLLAAGRNDGTVDLYDLESKRLISRTENRSSSFNGLPVKCITFSDNGECLFVGTADGISVIGWEPDREFDHIESAWSVLGDMQVVNKKLFCGSFENQTVEIHAINIDKVIPFYNPSNTPFSHNQSSRKSFTRGNHKLRLSIGSSSKSSTSKQDSMNENSSPNPSTDNLSSPTNNISFEMIEEGDEPQIVTKITNGFSFDNYASKRESYMTCESLPTDNYKFNNAFIKDTSSLNMEPETDMFIDNYTSDLDYYPRNSPGSNNVIEPERQDFPVNNAQPPDYAPKMDTNNHHHTPKTTVNKHHKTMQRRQSPPNHNVRHIQQQQQQQSRKLSNITSISTVDLHRITDETVSVGKKQISRSGSPVRNYIASYNKLKKSSDTAQLNRENNIRNSRKINVQIMVPPVKAVLPRSKTALDLRTPSSPASPATMRSQHFSSSNQADEQTSINILTLHHEQVYVELGNRLAMLQIIRHSMRSHDIIGALRQAIKMHDRSVLVDILGAILEKSSSWNLDMCLLLLPEIYELLQSNNRFHCTRACDTLRVIITSFLPIIQANTDPWGPSRALGVDITREERQNKCIDCRQWLLRIKVLPDNNEMGSTLTQLQNLIVDI